MNYILHILIILEVYILLALSVNQKAGYSGLLTLSQAVFYGVGAYGIAICSSQFGFNYWTSFIIAIGACIVFGLIVSFIAGKVIELYFSLATLAVQVIFFSIIYNADITNGSYGISGIIAPNFFGYEINSPLDFSIYAGSWVLLIIFFLRWFYRTPLHILIRATKDDEIAILNIGKNPKYYKRISILISSVIAGVAGTIYASYTTYIDPSSFTLNESILILSIALIGGSGSIAGSLVGALIYVLIPEVLKFLSIPEMVAANMRMVLFGMILVLIVRFKPSGIFGKNIFK